MHAIIGTWQMCLDGVKEAQQMLLNTDKTISDISEAVGSKTASHFGRNFAAIVGMTPSEYSRSVKMLSDTSGRM